MNERDASDDDDLRALLRRLYGPAAALPAAPTRDEAAALLHARCAAGPMTSGDQLVGDLLLQRVGTGDATLWARLLTDTARDVSSRSFALRVLSSDASQQTRALRLVTDDDDMDRLSDARMVAEMTAQLSLDVVPEELAMALGAVPASQRADRWRHIERCRRRALMPAALTWMHTLVDPDLASLRSDVLDAIDGEAGPAAALWLGQCLDQLDDAPLASALARRVATMERATAPRATLAAPEVRGWIVTEPGDLRLAFVLAHPEDVWLYGEFVVTDGILDVEEFAVVPEAPEVLPPAPTDDATVTAATRASLYTALRGACVEAQRRGAPLTWPPLLVLGMLEGVAR